MNLLHNFPSARKIATANKKQLIDAMKIDNQLYFDENKLDQIITLSKNSVASGNDAHELALQKRIELLVAFVGIDPRTEESGQMKKGWFINRKGNRYLRKAVYIDAIVAIQNNEYFKNYYMKLRTRGKSHTVAVLAVAGKLL